MITEPSVDQLQDKADSIYTVVILAAKRARHLNMGGRDLLSNYKSNKPVSKSLEEIAKDKISYRKKSKNTIK
ncbi:MULTISPECIES: DNA-directed RNA polymerase subunit omega [unclassified Halanaerobium]|uniref:DNA-directed RNA polymerase subunit omega n=1 Tax=unclassified Halanaerobium TaxID=2641197 RepID=UPI000DF3CB6D|nr:MULTISPECIES: DNA-directed RNA polymerase subunit omega [unclassified Halanaerobium]RCW51403.1 DNA-directed RNA polymerase subunit omega [Halanaerobium sp. MA284_MarDTE_T2]RCW89192.1 DNA-directed RNA polymerase subunit omega [Halanaerobium sp. DL-01]